MYLLPTTDLKEIQKRAERGEIYLYLSGLDSSYESIRSHILLSADLPSFKIVMDMIQREEARRRGMTGSQVKNSEEHEAQALSVKHYKPPFKKFQNHRPRERSAEEEKCSHCKKSGHTEVNCWFLHPHLRPAFWIDRGDNRKGETDRKGERMSGARQEVKRGADYITQKGFNAHKPLTSTIFDAGQNSAGSSGSGQDLMQQMFAQFTTWYTKQNNGCGMALNAINLNLNDQIILDSGATDHMFCNQGFLNNLDLTKNTKYVIVANGTKVKINGIRSYQIFSKEIKNVLYVKSFFHKFNFN
jgi:hypothetical protein